MPTAFLHAFAAPREEQFLSIVAGKGALVWDDRGNEYVDGIASLWYVNIGHGREEMAEAIAAQARTLASYMTFHPYTNPWAEEAAARIVALSPFPDGRAFLCTSGSEAVDTAIKLARIAQREAGHPERQIVVGRERGYHGSNYGGTSVQGIPANREGFGPLLPGTLYVTADDEEAMKQVFADHGGETVERCSAGLHGAPRGAAARSSRSLMASPRP